MRLGDYLWLSSVAIRAHKKRVVAVTIITGLLFSVIVAGYFILQGLENQVMSTLLAPTAGKVLVTSTADLEYCGKAATDDECDQTALIAAMKSTARHYGGTLLNRAEAGIVQTKSRLEFVRISKSFFPNLPNYHGEASEVLLSIKTAMELSGVEPATWEDPAREKIATIEQARGQTLGKIVQDTDGAEYDIADILPGGIYQQSLSLTAIGENKNPLNLLLDKFSTGASRNFLLGSAEDTQRIDGIELKRPEVIFAVFDHIEQAHAYFQDVAHQCTHTEQLFDHCTTDYAMQSNTLIGSPVQVYGAFQNLWQGYHIFATALTVIALIVMVSTFGRLIGRDTKIIALYHALGATKRQVRLLYFAYLLLLSLITIVFAMVVGLAFAVILSLANLEPLKQVFVISLSIATRDIWLVGWNWILVALAGCMLLAPLITIILQNAQFKSKDLSRALK